MSEAAMEAEAAAEENRRPDYTDENGSPHWYDEEQEADVLSDEEIQKLKERNPPPEQSALNRAAQVDWTDPMESAEAWHNGRFEEVERLRADAERDARKWRLRAAQAGVPYPPGHSLMDDYMAETRADGPQGKAGAKAQGRAQGAEKTNRGGNAMGDESTAKADGQRRPKYDEARIGRAYYNGNARAFYEGIMDGTLPAVSKAGAEARGGTITIAPVAVRSYATGKAFAGVNQLVAQKFAREMGFPANKDGSVYVITYKQAGEKNIMRGQKHFPLATYDRKKESVNYYNLYSERAIIDPAKVAAIKSPYHKREAPERRADIAVTATDRDITLADYFGKWAAATRLGARFVTSEEAMQSVRRQAEAELRPHVESGLSGKIYAVGAAIEAKSREELKSVIERASPPREQPKMEMRMSQSQAVELN